MPFTRFDKVAVIVGIAMAGWCAAITWQLLTNYFQPESFAAVSLPTESNKAGFVSSLQGYWIPSQAGLEIFQITFVYDLVDQRWFPVEDEFLRPPSEKRRFAVWNSSCIQCHAVAGKPRLKQPRDELWSTVAEFGIACESCHGPGEAHVAKHSNPLERYQQHFSKSADTTSEHFTLTVRLFFGVMTSAGTTQIQAAITIKIKERDTTTQRFQNGNFTRFFAVSIDKLDARCARDLIKSNRCFWRNCD